MKEDKNYANIIRESFHLVKSSQSLLWLLLISVVFAAGHVLLRPLLQIYLEQAGLDISLFGVAAAYWFFLGAFASMLADRFEKRAKNWSYVLLAGLWVLGMSLIASISAKWGFLLFGIVVISTAIVSIIIEHEILMNSRWKDCLFL